MDGLTMPCSEDERRELGFELLKGFLYSTFQTLLDVAGPVRTKELSSKYFKNHGEAGALSMQRRLGAQPGLPGALLVGKLAIIWMRRDLTYTVFPDHLYWENSTCLFDNAPAEFCMLWENVVTPAANQVLCPEYRCVCDRMVTQGDQVCSGRNFVTPENPYHGRLDEVPMLLPPPISREEADFWTIQVLGEEWVFCTRAISDLEDPDRAMELLYRRLYELGLSMAPILISTLTRDDDEALPIKTILDQMNQLFHQVGADTIVAPNYCETSITECPFRGRSQGDVPAIRGIRPGVFCAMIEL